MTKKVRGCPECAKDNGYIFIGRIHGFRCAQHEKFSWLRNLPPIEHYERFKTLAIRAFETGCGIGDCPVGGEKVGAPWALYDWSEHPADYNHYGLVACQCDLDSLDEEITKMEYFNKHHRAAEEAQLKAIADYWGSANA